MTSAGGTELTLEADNSIIASGANPDLETSTIRAELDLPPIAAIRLETLPHSSFPKSGSGRNSNGSFNLNNLTVAIAQRDDESTETMNPLLISRAFTSYHRPGNPIEHAIDAKPGSFWQVWPQTSVPQQRLAALKVPNSWVRLYQACLLHGGDAEWVASLETRPEVLRTVADLRFDDADWELAIAGYSNLINNATSDVSLLAKRGEAYFATQQFDLARADWRRATELVPELAQTQFDRLRQAERWGEAAEFGLLLIEQKPENSMLWVQVPPLAVLSEDDTVYPLASRAILEIFRKSPVKENFNRAIKACLLKPGVTDMAELSMDLLPLSPDVAAVPNWLLPWFWSTRALVAYRRGDAELAVKNVNQSERHAPNVYCHALNLSVLAMAQHQLGRSGQARLALEDASLIIARIKQAPNSKGHHDLLIAEILFQEAEALMNKKEQPDESVKESVNNFLMNSFSLLTPVEMKSEAGTNLTLRKDGSILASQEPKLCDSYTITEITTGSFSNARLITLFTEKNDSPLLITAELKQIDKLKDV